ncbi:DUF6600 domain-containing protein [Paracidobacterium acidisoli]|uniref:Uncharacterized protein n=1 Tax=Paracidobacterium acidisoli TaxID=2303751 RepID=A0A372IPV0_9BACT|nr:DUF6600 domain-containing protein [Paracidobacterium acidisoli]MBT9331328.1 FecR domain-containing protein [Paracidobacterium acidisoli]
MRTNPTHGRPAAATPVQTLFGIATAAALLACCIALPSAAQEPAAAPSLQNSTVPAQTLSKVRIVRLSEIKGTVLLDRAIGHGFEEAITNLPIVEGSRLQTTVGIAEIEFEDNSTLRVGPSSLIEFPKLELMPTGATLSAVKVLKGLVYVSLTGTKGNQFAVDFGSQTLDLPPSSHIRLQLSPSTATLAVLDGAPVPVNAASGTIEVSKKHTLTFDLASQNPPELAKKVTSDIFDPWDHDQADYHKHFASLSAFGGSAYSYGVSDMLYYGSFINAGGGCGSMWRPYFASAAWDPYSNGSWAWYSGAGYSWVSPYPWGWMPYHYGSWGFCSGVGWGWQPGGGWYGLSNIPGTATVPSTGHRLNPPGRLPHQPILPPIAGRGTLIAVSRQPLSRSSLSTGTSENFVFRNDSAGLGVPRGSLGNLHSFSREVEHHGSANLSVFNPASMPGSGPGESAAGRSYGPRSYSPGQISRTSSGAQRGGNMQPSGGGMQPGFSGAHASAPAAGPSMSAPASGGGRSH